MTKRLRIGVSGTVQGVGFRPFVYRTAVGKGLAGHVRNLGGAGVEIEVEGPTDAVDAFVVALNRDAPPLAEVEQLAISDLEPTGEEAFRIVQSSGGGESGGTLPPDVATCDPCLGDMDDPASRYHRYWATSCTDCGPRFTVIEGLPYDRPGTSMRQFPMCEACRREYTDPLDRRYHAQTIACPDCGPRLVFSEGGAPQEGEPVDQAIRMLQRGGIVAVKGIGGTHIACDATRGETVTELRRRLGRVAQPMAIMARAQDVDGYCTPTVEERGLLRSPRRPIVAVGAKRGMLPEELAPGLHTVGVMLPYSGLHHLLLEGMRRPLVMTSGNYPGRPMAIAEQDILEELSEVADGFLLHDRRIVARCDDSVMRMAGGTPVFLRRSRGWVPEPIPLALGDEPLLALGGAQDVVFALYDRGKVHLSQYIGDTEQLETLEYLQEAVEHLRAITKARKPARVMCDLHPGFATSRLAGQLGEPVPVQHHVAHVAGLAAEWSVADLVGIVVDGYGYGEDGSAWGGEVIRWSRGDWERVGSLSEIALPGGDLAALRPGRMAAAYFMAAGLDPEGAGLPNPELEAVRFHIESGVNCPVTTSAGRFLDAVSAWLGLCRERTYEGEPAMRLEAAGVSGSPHKIAAPLADGPGRRLVNTVELFRKLVELRQGGVGSAHIAATAQDALARGLARLALDVALREGVGAVGLTGGAAVNDCIAWAVRQEVERAGVEFFSHRKVPPGDGGLAFGQLAAIAERGLSPLQSLW